MTSSTGKHPAIIVAGPTCSGKSALALDLAERLGGTIINADSMQVYREVRILTARPTASDEARAPHRLYGIRPAAEPASAAWWREAALEAIADTIAAGRTPILCGGTGLYLAALAQGLAVIPDPGAAARTEARALLASHGPAALHGRLTEADPETAATLRPTDSQRIARAWEVWRGTGTGLAEWQRRQAPADPLPLDFTILLLDPPRDALRAAIAARAATMIAQGAIDEVSALLGQNLDASLPAMRAHGVPEFSAYLRGEIGLAEAQRRVCLVTGQYTKRQATWFRHRHIAASAPTHRFLARYGENKQLTERLLVESFSFIRASG
jgi:tRNA dimethylallyltransferase